MRAQCLPDPPALPPTGLFGTGIQSYFTFLRFLLMLNLLTLLLTSSFVLLPLVWLRPPDPSPALNFSEWLTHKGTVTHTDLRPGLTQGSECGHSPDPLCPSPGHPPTRVQSLDSAGPAVARQHLLTHPRSPAPLPLHPGLGAMEWGGAESPLCLGALSHGPSLPPSQPSSAPVAPSPRRVLSISHTRSGTF